MASVQIYSTQGGPVILGRSALRSYAAISVTRRALTSRRHYWSYRCGKPVKASTRSPYQYISRWTSLSQYSNGSSRNATSAKDEKYRRSPQAARHERDLEVDERDRQVKDDKRSKFWDDLEDAKDYRDIRSKMAEVAKEEMDMVRQMLRDDPYKIFGIGARYAFNPFMSHREWRERVWQPLQGGKSSKHEQTDGQSHRSSASKVPDETLAKQPEQTNQATQTKTESEVSSKPTNQIEEVYIDPISLRKVTRVVQHSADTIKLRTDPADQNEPATDGSINIPVKKFMAQTTMTDLSKEEIDALSTAPGPEKSSRYEAPERHWLAKEGFTKPSENPKPQDKGPSPLPKASVPATSTSPIHRTQSDGSSGRSELDKIQSSLDRLNLEQRETSHQGPPENLTSAPVPSVAEEAKQKLRNDGPLYKRQPLQYTAQERKDEDIDLLRASDVRAAAGHVKESNHQPSPEEVSARRQKISVAFSSSQSKLHNSLMSEFTRAITSEKPQNSTILKLWSTYAKEAEKTNSKPQVASLYRIVHDMMSRLALDSSPLENSARIRLERGAGTSLGRYLNANRISKALDELTDVFQTWNKSIVERLGQNEKESELLKETFYKLQSELVAYKNEIRRQMLAGPPKSEKAMKKQQAVDTTLQMEIQKQKLAMDSHEQRPKNLIEHPALPSSLWEDNLKRVQEHEAGHRQRKLRSQKQRDKRLYHEIRDIYETEYGAISTGHRQQEIVVPQINKESKEAAANDRFSEHDPFSHREELTSDATSKTPKPTKQVEPEPWGTVVARERSAAEEQANAFREEQREQLSWMKDELQALKDIRKSLLESTSEASSIKPTPALPESAKSVDLELKSSVESPKPPSEVYQILTYDEYTGTVVSATAKSSLPHSQPKSPAEILLSLERPQSFMEQMKELEQSGWELTDGGKKMLLFRMSSNKIEPNESTAPKSEARRPTIEPETTQQPRDTEHSEGPYTSYTGPKMRRQEPVFSGHASQRGSKHWQASAKQRSRESRSRKRMGKFLAAVGNAIGSGLVVLAGVYLIGLGAEWHRRRERAKEDENFPELYARGGK